MSVKSIIKSLKDKKIDVYVRNLGQYGCFRGVLKYITEEIIVVMSKYNKISYIPLSEIVIITEYDVKSEFLKDRIKNIVMVNSTS